MIGREVGIFEFLGDGVPCFSVQKYLLEIAHRVLLENAMVESECSSKRIVIAFRKFSAFLYHFI